MGKSLKLQAKPPSASLRGNELPLLGRRPSTPFLNCVYRLKDRETSDARHLRSPQYHIRRRRAPISQAIRDGAPLFWFQ